METETLTGQPPSQRQVAQEGRRTMNKRQPYRRSSGRIAVALPVHFSGLDGEISMIQTENISAGGMLLRSSQLIPTDRRLELSIALPLRGQELHAVVQARFVGPSDGGFAVGIEILEMTDSDRETWQGWCQHLPCLGSAVEEPAGGAAELRNNANILLVPSALPAQMVAALAANGHRLSVVRDPLEALTLLRHRRDIEIVICEVRRRDLDGSALCHLLKQERSLRELHVLLIAEPDSAADVVAGVDAGATYVVARPFTEEFLLSLITLCQRG
jgi:CheY-like chemotaxis protein